MWQTVTVADPTRQRFRRRLARRSGADIRRARRAAPGRIGRVFPTPTRLPD